MYLQCGDIINHAKLSTSMHMYQHNKIGIANLNEELLPITTYIKKLH